MNPSKHMQAAVPASSTWRIANAYDLAGKDYIDYADGNTPDNVCFSGKYAYADHHVWICLEEKLAELRRSGTDTLRVLDAGCGPGTWMRRLALRAKELGFGKIVARGFDLSSAQIEEARARSRVLAAEPGVNLEFTVGDLAATLPEADKSVDLTLCLYSVLSHIPPANLPSVIGELGRVTRGHLVATVRAVGSMPSGIVAAIEDVRRLRLDHRRDWCEVELCDGRKTEFDFHLFSSAELTRCFDRAFDVETLEGIDFFHNRFAGDRRWNPQNLDLSEPLAQKLAELEAMFASNPDYIDHANHLLLVGRPR